MTSFGEMLLRLSVPSGERLEAAKHLDVYPAGAGDALAAGVIHGWLDGDLAAALRYGGTIAPLTLGKSGGPTLTR